ncbi:PAS domain S-box protein [Patescibacteria group bacterium]|nr:PAS domain S-box protein [Patescibacteria group bacterium]
MINYQFSQLSILTLYSAVMILALGISILFRARKRIENWSFFIVAFMIFLWLSGIAMIESSKNSELALLWHNRYTFLGIALIPTSVYFLVVCLIDQFQKHKRKVFFTCLISAVFYILANIASFFGIQLTRWGYYPEYGNIGVFYLLYFLVLMVYSFYLLISGFKGVSDDLKKKQLKVFFIGLLLGFTASADFLITLGYNVYPFGYISILVFVAVTALAMKKYGFLILEPKIAFRMVFDSIASFVIGIDTENRIGFTNKPVKNVLGYKQQDVLEEPVKMVFPEQEKLLQMKDKILKGGRFISQEDSYFLTRDAKKIPIRFSLSPIQKKEYGERILGFALIAQDITERKKLEDKLKEYTDQLEEKVEERTKELSLTNEELRKANEALKQKSKKLLEAQEQLIHSERLAAIGQLASGIAHEIRNPLGVIKTAVYYIKTKVGEENPKVLKHLKIMEKEIGNSDKIISDLLGFSRTKKPSVKPTHLNKVIEDALLVTKLTENVKVIKKLSLSLPQVPIDANQIRQVFINIILNAFQAMPNGGELKIETAEKAHLIEVKFSDTGCGISKENLNKLFNPFFTTKSKGIGLGLAVTQVIIERHAGTIEAKSKSGQGSTFTIYLPLRDEV